MQGIGIEPNLDSIEINDGSTDGTDVAAQKAGEMVTPTPITSETERR